jgi:hypothetical protein
MLGCEAEPLTGAEGGAIGTSHEDEQSAREKLRAKIIAIAARQRSLLARQQQTRRWRQHGRSGWPGAVRGQEPLRQSARDRAVVSNRESRRRPAHVV